MNLLEIVIKHTQLKKASTTKGGEWQGPCPWCGGRDRFHVWPAQDAGRGTYWCRSCNKGGDAIQFLRDFDGMGFKEACEYLRIPLEDKAYAPGVPTEAGCKYQPRNPQVPLQRWQDKVMKLVFWGKENITKSQQTCDWLAARGIDQKAVEQYNLGWIAQDIFRPRTLWGLPEVQKENGKPKMLWIPAGLVIPLVVENSALRVRIRRLEGDPRYYILPGSSSATMVLESDREVFVVVESELDAIACAAASPLVGAVATGSLAGKPDAVAFEILRQAKQILVALDFGDEGGGKEASRRARQWWEKYFPDNSCRWPTPQGKDPGEAYGKGVDLKQWLYEGLWPVIRLSVKESLPVVEPQEKERLPNIMSESEVMEIVKASGLPGQLVELWRLLQRNPMVRIINRPDSFTIMRGDKPGVGGRIQELVLLDSEVRDYILDHGVEEINGENLIKQEGGGK